VRVLRPTTYVALATSLAWSAPAQPADPWRSSVQGVATTEIVEPARIAISNGFIIAVVGAQGRALAAPDGTVANAGIVQGLAVGGQGSAGAGGDQRAPRRGLTAEPTRFVVTGEGGQSISVTVPDEVGLTREGGGETAVLLTDSDLDEDGPQLLRGEFGSAGALSFSVGGQVTLANNMAGGTYNGVLAVVAQYN